METLIPEGAKRGIAIFAHPDDESLWCGGLLSRGDVEWTVVCCTIPQRDPIRAYKFFSACEILGVRPRLLPFAENDVPIRVAEIALSGFDIILTHGLAGEYGHAHHVELHKHFASVPRARFVGYGGYGRFELPLDEKMKAKKIAALKSYDHWAVGDDAPKWKALIDYYGKRFDLWNESYD